MFQSFAQVLYEKGMSLDTIAAMAIRNPARLLGIEPRNTGVVAMDELFGVAQAGGQATTAAADDAAAVED